MNSLLRNVGHKIKSYDYCWFLENYFWLLLNNNVDLFLYYPIFKYGEILYNENDFVSKVLAHIAKCNLSTTFKKTYHQKEVKLNDCVVIWAKNLSRILHDYVCSLFIDQQKITNWHSLPHSDELTDISLSLGIIDKKTFNIYKRLRELSKIKEESFVGRRLDLCAELLEIDSFVNNKINNILT